MSDIELQKRIDDVKNSSLSETSMNKFLFGQEKGIVYENGERQVNTGFAKIKKDVNDLISIVDKDPENDGYSSMKKELIKSKNWIQLYEGNKEKFYKEFLNNDSDLTLLKKAENGSKSIDSQLVLDELGKEKGNALLSQYFIKNQLKIRQSIPSLDSSSILTMIDAFAEKNKIGLNNNQHFVTVDLNKKGPFNNEQFASFLSNSPNLKYEKNDFYYNHEQKGWKSFRDSEAVQLAYLKDTVNKGNDLKLTNASILESQMNMSDNFFKEAKVEERKLPVKNNNQKLHY
jgi:hypothetical protein